MFGAVTEVELRKVSVADTEVRKVLCSYLYAEQTSGLQGDLKYREAAQTQAPKHVLGFTYGIRC